MSSQPPSSPDGPSLPARHRPNAENLAKDTTERDLWDLDDLMIDDTESTPLASIEPIRRRAIPAAQEPRPSQTKSPETKPGSAVPVLNPRASVVRRISKNDRARAPLAGAPSGGPGEQPIIPSKSNAVERTFDELEHWDVTEPPPAIAAIEEVFDDLTDGPAPSPPASELSEPSEPEPAAVADLSDLPELPEPTDAPPPADGTATQAAATDDEFTPKTTTATTPRPHLPLLKLSQLEKIGMACFALILLGGGIWAYRSTISRMADHSTADIIRYPVKGKQVTITKVRSYWREPITTGDHAEIVRRGVVLIPVVEVTVTGQGAIRALFCDDKGVDVGDPMVREVNGDATLVIPATVGFEEMAMHAAYQARLTPPWHLRIAEAATAETAGAGFVELAKPPIDPTLQ